MSHPEAPEIIAEVTPAAAVAAPPRPRRERFLFVDALRGLAAMGVVVYHAYEGGHMTALIARLPRISGLLASQGHLGVPVFFVLSGFVIAYSIGRNRVDGRFLGRFALRRSIRLDPPYWASIALVVAAGLVSRAVIRTKVYRPPSAAQVLAHLAYLQDILRFPAINPIYWTLCLEIQFYLVFCLLMYVADRLGRADGDRRALAVVFLPAAIVSACYPLGLLPPIRWPGLFPPFWHGFLLGAFACWAMVGTIRHATFYAYAVALAVAAARGGSSFTGTCVATAVVLLEVARLGKLTTWLSWRPLQFLGMISYSLYLVHNPVSGAAFNVAYRVLGRGVAAEAIAVPGVLALNVAFAAVFWRLFEKPSMDLAHHVTLAPGRAASA